MFPNHQEMLQQEVKRLNAIKQRVRERSDSDVQKMYALPKKKVVFV
jgi:hypothetical protein